MLGGLFGAGVGGEDVLIVSAMRGVHRGNCRRQVDLGGFRQSKLSSTSKAGVPPCTCCWSHRKHALEIYLDASLAVPGIMVQSDSSVSARRVFAISEGKASFT